MISLLVYKFFHLTGIMMVFLALGGAMVHAINGGAKATNQWRKGVGITHGIGIVLILVSGFGMLARLGIHWPWPAWIIIKMVIWLVIGILTAFIYRLGSAGKSLWYATILLGIVAAILALFKPL
jgi:hypothetical protein